MNSPDPGQPISYMMLVPGMPVFSSDGIRLGEVDEVGAEPEIDIFDGIGFKIADGRRYADAAHVGSLFERRVELAIDAEAAMALPDSRRED
ncbi:MAG: hypothetical protein H0V29_09340 [Thermoleophilaceae bacterium]|nr:hypothetical protein [Thermoleophilaceae bacterium]